jgi:integrase
MESIKHAAVHHVPWKKGKLVGQKAPLKQREIWAIRIRLQLQEDARELALFNLAIDSKLRSCDLVRLRVRDICQGGRVASRAIVMQRKTQRPVQFEITEPTRESLSNWMREATLGPDDYLFLSRLHDSPHLSTRQYARIVHRWVTAIGLNPAAYGTHTMRRTKAALIYRRTKNLRVVQLLLGHSRVDSVYRAVARRSRPFRPRSGSSTSSSQHRSWSLRSPGLAGLHHIRFRPSPAAPRDLLRSRSILRYLSDIPTR